MAHLSNIMKRATIYKLFLPLYYMPPDPVSYTHLVLRDGAWSSRATLNMRGGGKTARYFVSGSYQDQQGM